MSEKWRDVEEEASDLVTEMVGARKSHANNERARALIRRAIARGEERMRERAAETAEESHQREWIPYAIRALPTGEEG